VNMCCAPRLCVKSLDFSFCRCVYVGCVCVCVVCVLCCLCVCVDCVCVCVKGGWFVCVCSFCGV